MVSHIVSPIYSEKTNMKVPIISTPIAVKPRQPHFSERTFYSSTLRINNGNTVVLSILGSNNLVACFEVEKQKGRKVSLFVLRNSYEIKIEEHKVQFLDLRKKETREFNSTNCPYDFLEKVCKQYRESIENKADLSSLTFKPGLLGYFGYGLTTRSQNTPKQKERFLLIPDAIMFIPGCFIEYDHHSKSLTISSDKNIEECNLELSRILAPPLPSTTAKNSRPYNQEIKASIPKSVFLSNIAKIKERIVCGEAFQVVLSQRFSVNLPCKAVEFYEEVRKTNSSAYSYYFNFGEFQYIGSSPESFIEINDKKASLKALAGTRPKGANYFEERKLEEELLSCPKENAEHMMLVDLGRNDLGRVCQSGSVKVVELKEIVKATNVIHLSSTIKGLLKEEISAFNAVKACFPRGTVSGAPKRRALKILSGLENEQRGIYSGCIGLVDIFDNAQLAIAIRGATIQGNTAHIQAGAGIVYDSVPETEYQETIHKANSMLKPLERLWR